MHEGKIFETEFILAKIECVFEKYFQLFCLLPSERVHILQQNFGKRWEYLM